MKICLIGPTYPFRGGISHYTTLLYRHLRKRHKVFFFAFKRQYPKFLFPGETDKDNSVAPLREHGVENILDSVNPLSWMVVAMKIKKLNPDLIILPWWVVFWAPQFWTIVSMAKMLTRSKVLFICHNVVEHESNILKKVTTKVVLKKGDYFIVHSAEDFDNLKRIKNSASIRRNFHPTYEVFRSEPIAKETARSILSIRGNTILFFGFVRPYKGLSYLIEALPLIQQHIDVNLLIVGEFWKDEDSYQQQIERLGITDRVSIINEYIPNEKVPLFFAAADVAVLPYTSATGSGIVQIAFGCHKPVVTTTVGCLPEVVTDGKTGYLVPPKDPSALADAVVRFYKNGKEVEFAENIIAEKAKFSWDRMRETIESFYT